MNNKKLLLVSANRFTVPYPVYPLGISYLKAFLNEAMPALKVRLFDFMTGSFEDYERLIAEMNPDFVGISIRNIDDVNIYRKESFISHYRQIVSVTRESCRAVVIMGGSGFSIYPQFLFDYLQPDFGIYGEGELSLQNLITSLENNGDYSVVEGLVYSKNGKTIVNRRNHFYRAPAVNFDNDLVDYYWNQSGMLNIQTKRGCPYKCIYCTYPLIEGNRVRTIDPAKIVKTLAHLSTTRNINYVFFTDSIFNITNRFNNELADRLIAEDLKLEWGAYFNFTNIDTDLLEKLKRAGLRHIEFGTDSLSDEMLRNYGKPFGLKDVMKISSVCTDLGIDSAHFLILGGYGETEKTLDETFQNSTKIARTVFFPFIGMRIYPGTRLHEIAIREGIVGKDDNLLEPVYYVSRNIDLSTLKVKARKTEKQWIFPDEDLSPAMTRLRKRNKKGPLWEYLLK